MSGSDDAGGGGCSGERERGHGPNELSSTVPKPKLVQKTVKWELAANQYAD